MPIKFFSYETNFTLKQKKIIRFWLNQISSRHDKKIKDLSIVFCSEEKILEINNQYLGHDYYTDIISFDYSDKNLLSGELFISVDTVKTNSSKFNSSFENELHRVIIHGLLHFIGFNDKTKKQILDMRKAEEESLNLLYSELVPRGTIKIK